MKELIGKLSRGTIEYNLPELEVSVTTIEENVEAGSKCNGSFEIFSGNGMELKGIIYSTDERFRILNDQFIGKDNVIRYEISGEHMERGEKIKGRLQIVSNGGEMFIPFSINIIEEGLPSSIGDIYNLYHFINLVKQEYDEALKMFLNPAFERIILKGDIASGCLYRGLISGYDKRKALEEFILSIHKKQQVSFALSDEKREYDSLEESYGDIITITRNTWGYAEVDITSEGEFISDYKSKITTDDFAGNNYELSFLIDVDRLHAGMNYGKIIFTTMTQRLECVIVVDNIKERDTARSEVNKCIIELNRSYLDFRMHKYGMDTWAEKSMELIERARGFKDDGVFLRLLQAQIYISKKRDEDAKWLLDSVAEEILDRKDEDVVMYCYYLYVRTLQKRELEQTILAAEIIRKYYENGYDKWELLWILLYIDTSYENNKSLKLTRIKEQYKLGCRSTLMYYEALYVLNKQPGLLRVLNGFELQVLNFGSKYDAIDLRLAVQISELAMLEKNFRPILFRILVKLYQKFENKMILNAIISILIRGNKMEHKYFQWYELGIRADVQVTRIYEYYIYSMSEDYDGEIPNTVLMYYVYNGNLLFDKEAFFYTRIIRKKEKHPNVYKNYRKTMERFALEKLREGKIDEYIAEIYEDILTSEMITDENEKKLVQVLNTWKLSCNDKRICEVMIIHKEIKGINTYTLSGGVAYVNIYTDDAIILFKDCKGNIYHNTVEYQLKKLFTNKELDEMAILRNEDNVYLMAKECEQSLKYHKSIPSGITLFRKIMCNDEFRTEYKDFIMQDIIEYYTNHYDGDELDDYLLSIDVGRLGNTSRTDVMELMIMRGLYDKVAEYLTEYGYERIDPRKILKYCSRILKDGSVAEEDDSLVKYCNYAFSKGKYNEITLEYLCRFYNGSTKEMAELWRVSKEFHIESRELEERLIVQMLFSRSLISSISTIYDSYYKNGALEMVRYAYLFFLSHEYFVKENPVDDMFFKHLEDELMSDNELMDVCLCAYLKYYSAKQNISKNTQKVAEESISYLAKKNIIFDFYRSYSKWFNLAGNILDKTTIVYRTVPQDKVMISYYLETGNLKEKEYTTEEMKCVFKGMYIKSFTLFYGERLKYYISEVSGKDVKVTESNDYQLDDRGIETNSYRYGMLNDILVCRELKEEDVVNKLAKKYYVTGGLTKKLF